MPVSYLSPTQVNFVVTDDVPEGKQTLRIGGASSEVIVAAVAPGIFTLPGNGTGAPVGSIIGVTPTGNIDVPYFACDQSGCREAPIKIPSGATNLYLVLYGTGFRNAQRFSASLPGSSVQVLFAGAHGSLVGVDQLNLKLDVAELRPGRHGLSLEADGWQSNTVTLLVE